MTWEPPSAGWREVYDALDVPPPEWYLCALGSDMGMVADDDEE
jgi:hypothetical protein